MPILISDNAMSAINNINKCFPSAKNCSIASQGIAKQAGFTVQAFVNLSKSLAAHEAQKRVNLGGIIERL